MFAIRLQMLERVNRNGPVWGRFRICNLVELGGLEPPTFCLPDKRSPSELQPRSVDVC